MSRPAGPHAVNDNNEAFVCTIHHCFLGYHPVFRVERVLRYQRIRKFLLRLRITALENIRVSVHRCIYFLKGQRIIIINNRAPHWLHGCRIRKRTLQLETQSFFLLPLRTFQIPHQRNRNIGVYLSLPVNSAAKSFRQDIIHRLSLLHNNADGIRFYYERRLGVMDAPCDPAVGNSQTCAFLLPQRARFALHRNALHGQQPLFLHTKDAFALRLS